MSDKTIELWEELEKYVDINDGFFEMWFPETGATVWFAPSVDLRPGYALVRTRGSDIYNVMPIVEAFDPVSDRMLLINDHDFDSLAEAIIREKTVESHGPRQ